MITVDHALGLVLDHIESLSVETTLLEQAHNRMLAEDIRADIDLPPFDRARMDGYAVRSADVGTAPVNLKIIGEIAAGATFDGEVNAGEAVKIFTGAPVPRGADSVQKVEVTETDGHSVTIKEAVKPGLFVTPHASEVSAGELVAERGRKIGAAEMAVLASFGYVRAKVYGRPRIAII